MCKTHYLLIDSFIRYYDSMLSHKSNPNVKFHDLDYILVPRIKIIDKTFSYLGVEYVFISVYL